MSFPMSPARLAVAALLLLGLMPLALPVSAEEAVSRRSLITAKVDERQLVTLEGNTRPEVAVAQSHQAVEDALPLQHMHLQLRRSAAQEQAVAAFIDSLTDKSSPNFHHWLTATDFGQRFGVPQADIDKVSAWLRAKGMTVNFVYPSRMVIDFSGTAGQVKAAFHTEIHRLNVDGVDHIANVSDPQIPAALAPAVQGVVSLHDFRARNKLVHKPKVTGGCQGQTCWDVGPGDLQTIYGITALYNAGYTGKGEVIAVVEDTNLYQYSDWSTFRGVFGLTKYSTGNLQVVQPAAKGKTACQNPGVVSGNDGEATLDAEWASAAAPGATILLASCADTATTDGVYLAAQNLVNGANPPPVISISYGICEVQDGQAENAAFSSLYQMAAALGISVFVATGDNGPTDCAPNGNGTTAGIGVNGWATSAYNVAVGGTDFLDTYAGTNAAYWKANAGGTYSTAKSYVPEFTWNDTCASPQVGFYWDGDATPYGASGFCNSHEGSTFLALGGGEGGPSSCFKGRPSIPNVVSGTCQGNPKPIWQAGVIGIPVDHLRDVPDVSLFASDGSVWSHNYATCFTDRANGGGPCTGNPVTWAANAGGTSYATPIMAAIQALVDQFNRGRQGNVVQKYYQLAAAEYGKSGNSTCSASLGNKIGAGCIFHDIVSGTTDMPCRGTYNCYRPSGRWGVLSTTNSAYRPAYNAGIGYDLATGIGSVNAYNLATKW